MTQFHRCLFVVALIGVCALAVLACTPVVLAQDATDTAAVRTSVSSAGLGRYQRGQWSAVTISASNRGDEDTEATLSLFLENDSRLQFTRRFWIPAGANRKTWLPIRPSESIRPGKQFLNVAALNVVESDGGAILVRTEGAPLLADSLLSLGASDLQMAAIYGRSLPGRIDRPTRLEDEAYETIVEVRMMHDGGRLTSTLNDYFLPPHAEAYDALDQLVICSDRLSKDSGGMAALRDWIARGGRAWIMLDLVGMEAVRTLLGNAAPCEVVERVQLTEFTIDTPASATVGIEPVETWVSEEPADLVRVLPLGSADVYSSIDGWPAAFSIPFGDGHVLFTTLAARGWRYQYDEFAEPVESNRPTSGPTNALRNLASEFNQQPPPDSVLGDELKPVLSEQLGYRVPSRGSAALILGLNCIVIVIAGAWLTRHKQLERMAFVVPFATVISAIGLITIGSASTSRIPATSAVLRLANVNSATNAIHADVLAAFYSPETVPLPLEIDLSGVVNPEIEDLTGVAKRESWDDHGRGRWEQVSVASGSVRFARARESRVLEHPLRARAEFGPNGLQGRIIGVDQIGTLADAVIVSPPAPHSDVRIDQTGAFQAGANDRLSATEYVSGAMLSDQQQRRQTIYRQILSPRQVRVYPQRSTLFVWGDSHSFGLTTPEVFQQSGATLYAVPLDIGRTLPKQPFLVPPTFIRMRNAAQKQGASAFFNPRTGRWLKDATLPTQSFFQFLLPREVVPCQVRTAEMTLKIHAPSRTVELTGMRNGQQVTIETFDSPSRVLTFTVDDPELLALDGDGGLQFGVTISPTPAQAAGTAVRARPYEPGGGSGPANSSFEHATWSIDYLHLQVGGETL